MVVQQFWHNLRSPSLVVALKSCWFDRTDIIYQLVHMLSCVAQESCSFSAMWSMLEMIFSWVPYVVLSTFRVPNKTVIIIIIMIIII